MDATDLRLLRRPDLLRTGTSADEIRARLRSGDLQRVYAGVYRSAADASSLAGSAADAELHAEHDLIRAIAGRSKAAALSDRSASITHRVPVPRIPWASVLVHVTRDARSGGSTRGRRRIHARPLSEDDVVIVDGLRVTSIPRTCLDLACGGQLRDVMPAIDHVLHERLAFPQDLVEKLSGAGRRAGIAQARRAFAMADGRSESFGESVLRVVLHEIGFTVTDLQVVVRAPNGAQLGRVDLAIPEYGVLIEFDGHTKYVTLLRPGESASDVVVREKARENRMAECGYVVVRVVWADLFRPEELRVRLDRAVDRGRRAMAAGIVTGTLTPNRPIKLPLQPSAAS